MPPPHNHHYDDYDDLPEVVLDKVDDIEGFLGDDRTNRRMSRSAFNDGPWHRRASTAMIAAMLIAIAEQMGVKVAGSCEPSIGVDFDTPPHLREKRRFRRGSANYRLPTRLLTQVFGDDSLDEIVDCLVEGPPHDGASNLILIKLLETVFAACNDPKSEFSSGKDRA